MHHHNLAEAAANSAAASIGAAPLSFLFALLLWCFFPMVFALPFWL